MNLKESEDGYKETTEIKSNYQQRDRTDRHTESLSSLNSVSDDNVVMTFNIRYL